MSERPLFDRLLLGVGAMKAGTTWTYSVLSHHPQIHFTPEKELHYFYARHVDPDVLSERARLGRVAKYVSHDTDRARAPALRARLRWVSDYLDGPVDDHWYRALFAGRRDGQWPADFSNLYALLPEEGWARIAAQSGTLRVLYTLRDPLERLWSHVKFHLRVTGSRQDPAAWSDREMQAFIRQRFIWENAEYGAALRRMRAALPEGALLVTMHEAVHADPVAAIAGIEAHMGLMPGNYPADLLTRRVNATAPRPVPESLLRVAGEDADRIAGEIAAEGFTIPESWTVGGRIAA